MLQFGVSQLSIVIMLTLMMLSFADCMKIKVIFEGDHCPIELNKKDTVATLKAKIEKVEEFGKITIQKQVLFNKITGSVLEDKKTMDEYGIGEGDPIYLEVVTDTYYFPIDVSYGSRQTIVWVKCTDTVKDLKKKIANFDELGNIPIQKQVLTKEITWNSWVDLIDDQKTIDKYAIGEGKNVFVSCDEFEFIVEYKEKMNPINVNAMTTIKEVKEKMTQITGIPAEKQTLSHFKYGQIFDHSRLINYMKEDMPFLIMSDGSGITVWWTNHFWEFFVINVNGTDTVATVKEKIREINKQRHKSELDGAIIKLSKCHFDCEYAKAVEDKKTMNEYGIGEGNTIHMKVLYWEEIWDESSSPSSSAAVADNSIFHIHVRYGSRRVTIWVNDTDTVQSLKGKFGDISLFKRPFRVGINELVDNEKTMDEYGIKEGDTIESLNAERLG